MSTTAVVFVGLIALATLVTAVSQVLHFLVMARLAKQVEALASRIEKDVRPLVDHATVVAANAARVSDLAVAQMERADQLLADVAQRIDDTTRLVQGTLLAPARQGRALLAAIGAAIGVVRAGRGTRAGAVADDDDPLFIG